MSEVQANELANFKADLERCMNNLATAEAEIDRLNGHAPSTLPDRVASRYQEGFVAGYRKAQEDLGVATADQAASYKVMEIENYRLALAWISKQSNDPKSRELASEALEAFEAAADTSTDGKSL